jgi:SAM-dependent methyltransferase
VKNKRGWLEYWVDPKTWTFVGNFEGMYRDFDDPWLCQKRNESIERRVILAMLGDRQYGRVLDIGCGLGGFTDKLRRFVRASLACGLDISPTAVAKAAERFPDCEFVVADITRDKFPHEDRPYDLILIQEVVWYVLPHLSEIFARVHAALGPSGTLFIDQSFPSVQNFGREYLDSPDSLITKYLCPARFNVELQFRQVLEAETVLLANCGKPKTAPRMLRA